MGKIINSNFTFTIENGYIVNVINSNGEEAIRIDEIGPLEGSSTEMCYNAKFSDGCLAFIADFENFEIVDIYDLQWFS